ncbi:MAG: HAMP domain-containing sensor histidine kinase [Gemmatimonadaceae bacterium]
MNAALMLSTSAFALQLGLGVLLLGVARAPRWRVARLFAILSFSAALFSLGNILTLSDPTAGVLRDMGSRLKYFAAGLHVCGWLIYTHAGTEPTWPDLSPNIRSLIVTVATLGVMCLLTGWHSDRTQWSWVDVPWAHVRYRLAGSTLFGEITSYVYVAALVPVLIAFVRQAHHGERGAQAHFIGFVVFYACGISEMLVANGVINFLLIADVGFLAVMIPLAVETLHRFTDAAEQLSWRTAELAGEVEVRTRERDQAQGALLESERHASLGRLAAGVAHEINNPLSYVRLNVELIGEWMARNGNPEEVRESVESALDGSDRIRRVVDALRAYTRASTGKRLPLSPPEFVQSALRVCEHNLRPVAQIDTAFGITPSILGDEPKLVQLMVNLLTNAADALKDSPPDSDARILIRTSTAEDGEACIEVIDNGPGIPSELVPMITEPYFTTREATGGTGLGLFLARATVDQHGGRLEFLPVSPRGARVRVTLSAAPSVLESIAARPPGSCAPHMGLEFVPDYVEPASTL